MLVIFAVIVVALFFVFVLGKATFKALKNKDYPVAGILGSTAVAVIAALAVVTISAYQ